MTPTSGSHDQLGIDDALIDVYQRDLVEIGGRARSTADGHATTIRRYLACLAEVHAGTEAQDVTRRHIEDHLAMLARRGNAASTRARALSHLRSFYRWLRPDGAHDPAAGVAQPRIPRRRIVVYTPQEADAIIETTARDETHVGRFDLAVIAGLRFTGARAGELRRLDLDDYDVSSSTVRLIDQRDHARVVPVPSRLTRIWDGYFTGLRGLLGDTPAFFPNLRARAWHTPRDRISRRTLAVAVERRGEEAGASGRNHPHRWRHTYATHLLRSGADLHTVQRLLGHDSLRSTERYLHLVDDDLRDAIDHVYR